MVNRLVLNLFIVTSVGWSPLSFAGSAHPTCANETSGFSKCVQAYAAQMMAHLNQPNSIKKIGGSEKFSPSNSDQQIGRRNSGIYRSSHEGKKFLLKTVPADQDPSSSKTRFQNELLGMLLGAELGGPSILRAGKFRQDDGRSGFYLEMEELFANDPSAASFKGIYLSGKTSVKGPNSQQLKHIAKMLVLALERGIDIGTDVDFLFSRVSDEVHWIDTSDWRPFSDAAEKEDLETYGYFLSLFHKYSKQDGRILTSEIRELIKSSNAWTPQQKDKLWANLKSNLIYRWNWLEADADPKPTSLCEDNLDNSLKN